MALDVRQKIQQYLQNHPEYKLYRESELVSIMESEGVLTASEVEAAKKGSAFGAGFADMELDSFKPTSVKPREKKNYTPEQKNMARAYLAQILFQQALELYQIYWDTANNRSIGNEGMMELQEAGSFLVKNLDLDKVLGIAEPETRGSVYEKVNRFINDAVKMANCSDEEFEELYTKYFDKAPDYSPVIDYIENVKQVDTYSKLKLDVLESAAAKELKENTKRFEEFNGKLAGSKLANLVQDWSGSTLNGGGLVDLGFNMALLYGTGGFGAAAKGSMMAGEAMQTAMRSALTQVGLKKSASEIISQMAGITATQMTNAAVTSAGFNLTRVLDAVKDGDVTPQERAQLQESAVGLFKFGYVGGALSGPLGAKVSELTSRMLNSEPVISRVLQATVTNKPTALTNVLRNLSEHSNALGAVMKFGTEFSVNAGYMAAADGMSYGEAIESLAQMDAVSKMVVALLGGKNLSFLTPEKVQQINTELAGFKVKLSVFKGQKVYEVTDKNGKVVKLAGERELVMFIMDKVAAKVTEKTQPKKLIPPEVKPLSENECIEALKELNFTEEEIKAIDLSDIDARKAVNVIDVVYKNCKPEDWDLTNPDVRSTVLEQLSDKKNLNEFLQAFKYTTPENIKLLSKNIEAGEGREAIVEILEGNENFVDFFNALPVLTKNGKRKLSIDDAKSLKYCRAELYNSITPERIDFVYKLNEKVSPEFSIRISDVDSLGDTKDLTPSTMDEYTKEAKRFEENKLNYLTGYNSIKEKTSAMKVISDMLDKYPMDLNCPDGKVLDSYLLKELSIRKDVSEIQQYVDSLSKEAKDFGCRNLGPVDVGFPKDKLAEVYNIIHSPDYGKVDKFSVADALTRLTKNGQTDFEGIVKLIETFKGSGILNQFSSKKYLDVKNGDYDGARQCLIRLRELGFDMKIFENLISDINTDFERANTNLKYLQDNKLNFLYYRFNMLFSDNNMIETVKKIESLKEEGATDTACQSYHEIIAGSEISFEDFKAKLELYDSMNPGVRGYDRIRSANSEILPEDMKNSIEALRKNGVPENLLPLTLRIYKSNQLNLAVELSKNENYKTSDLYKVAESVNDANASLIADLCNRPEFPLEIIARIGQASNNVNIELLKKLVNDIDFPKFLIPDIATHCNKTNIKLIEDLCSRKDFPKDSIQYIDEENLGFVTELCNRADFPKDNISRIVQVYCDINKNLLKDLCNRPDFPKDKVADIGRVCNAKNIDLAVELCARQDIPPEDLSHIIRASKDENRPFLQTLFDIKELDKSKIPAILDSMTLKDGVNFGHVDTNKIKRYTALLQNPNTSGFIIKILNDGVDIHTAAFLSRTKQNFYSIEKAVEKKSGYSEEQQNVHDILAARGLGEKESASIVKAISTDGIVDLNMQQEAMRLINSGIAHNRIGEILASVKINGEYNRQIVDDFISIKNLGLNPLLERNLPVLNNISAPDVAVKFNSKVKGQLKAMIERLPDALRYGLKERNFDLDLILKKLDTKIVKESDSVPDKAKIQSGFRSKSSITGFEKIVVNKYNPDEKIWRNKAETKKWAEEKYNDFKNHNWLSQAYPDANMGRKEGLKEWFEFLDTEPEIKDNPYARILVTEFVTKDLHPENADIPPQLDKQLVKEILNSANVNFSKVYSERVREKAMQDSHAEEVEVDGIKGKWYTVPQTDKSSGEYKKNVDKVKAFSDGTNWCIRTYNAEPYVQQGAMHFFVDENGLTQVCIRETEPGSVYEIQKRQQNATVPIPYVNVITDYMSRNNLQAQYSCKKNIDTALEAKPEFDRLHKEIQELMQKQDYKAIFAKIGIEVIVGDDKTLSLSHYSPVIGQFNLSELGVRENDLLSNVSHIRCDADFRNSNATALPRLELVGGKFIFEDCSISNVHMLKEINGYKIDWNK